MVRRLAAISQIIIPHRPQSPSTQASPVSARRLVASILLFLASVAVFPLIFMRIDYLVSTSDTWTYLDYLGLLGLVVLTGALMCASYVVSGSPLSDCECEKDDPR